jgi:hypothetical protein
MMARLTTCLVLTALATSAGCGRSDLVPAGGQVVYEGKPVVGAAVMFIPDSEKGGVPANGATNDQGQFTLSTSGVKGIRPGPYKVTVTKTEMSPIDLGPAGNGAGKGGDGEGASKKGVMLNKKMAMAKANVRHLLPTIFSAPDSTPLRAEVPPGGKKNLEITLDGKGQ